MNILWMLGTAINLTLFYVNIYHGDYLYATLACMCALVFFLNIK